MSKLTRSSVALASAAALVVSGFAGVPASAAGQSDTSFVALAPTSGESYNVLAVAGREFSLSANQADSITANGRNVKFLVSDPNEAVRPAAGTVTISAAGTLVVDDWSVTSNVLQVTDSAHGLVEGDLVYIAGITEVDDETTDVETVKTPGWRKITAKTTNTFDVAWTNGNVVAAAPGNGLGNFGKDSTGTYLKFARATDKSFVVDTGIATNVADKVLVLENTASTATVSVDVTAWVDSNGDGDIDTTEYVSPTRTVTFVKASTVVPTVTWTPVVIGDTKIAADVTLSPSINFDQEPSTSFEVDFSRQGSADVEGTLDSVANVSDTWTSLTEVYSAEARLFQSADNTPWTGITKQADINESNLSHVAKAGKVVTIFTTVAHAIKLNDRVTVTAADDVDAAVNAYDESKFAATTAVVSAVTEFSFSYSVASDTVTIAKTASLPDGTGAFDFTVATFGYATAGSYQATVKLGGTPVKIGATSVIAAGVQVTAGVKNVATVTADVSSGFSVRAGTVAAVQVTSSVTNSDGTSVGAGIPVSIAVTETSTGVVTVNGTTVTTSKTINTTTDANGQVVISVTNSSGLNTQTVALAVSSQGFSDTDTLTWAAASYSLTDSLDNSTVKVLHRNVAASSEVAFNLRLADQWGAAPAGDFRIKAVGTGTRYDFTTYAAMSNGALNYTLTDSPVSASTMTGTVTFSVQQKNTAGGWGVPGGTAPEIALASANTEIHADGITINVRGTNGTTVSLNANAVSSADLSVASTVTKLVAADTRDAGVAANDVSLETGDVTATITGTIKDKFTGVAQPGSVVTLSGNAAILFSNGVEEAFGSINLVASSTGTFTVNAFSNSGLTDSVVTVTSNGASSTLKLTFTGSGSGSGNTFTITAPASAMPGTTFQVKGKLADTYGNGVTVASPDIKVTYTGPGLVVGLLPTATDAFGEFVFSVLLGSNDSGSAVITASYDQGSDDDFTGTAAGDLDIVVTKTVVIGAAVSAEKVNAGSFKGYVALYAKGYAGKRMSAKVGKDWVVVASLASDFERVVEFTGAGVDVAVRIYIDRVLIDTINLTTK